VGGIERMAGQLHEATWFVFLLFSTLSSLVQSFHLPLPPPEAELFEQLKIRNSVMIDSVRELYQSAIGAHPEQCQ
jgi:hypothetical protein